MNFTTATYRQNRQLANLVNKLSKDTRVEKSVVLHFLYTDLERIYLNKILIHTAKLKSTEIEYRELNLKEQQLIQLIANRAKETTEIEKRISRATFEFEQKSKRYSEIQIQLGELRKKLTELNSNISELEKEKKQVEYKVMMKTHSIKKKTDFSFKRLGWILTAFTIIGILIALLLIFKK